MEATIHVSLKTSRVRKHPERHPSIRLPSSYFITVHRESFICTATFLLYLKLHALRFRRIVFNNVQFDSVLYTFVLARRYIEDTICFVPLSSRRRVN